MANAAPSVPPAQRRHTERDLARATWLRPRDIFELYGIPASTLCVLATHEDESRRPDSRFVRPRGGRKGIRLFPRAEFEAWLTRWSAEGDYTPTPKKGRA